MIKAVIFILVSLLIISVSWPSLRNPRSYGFPRFFAFESTLAVIILNIEHWFEDPFNPRQLLSWVFLCASGFLIVHGVTLLRSAGRPSQGFEQTTQLVRVGAYRFIRHPLYSSVLFLAWGAFLKQVTLLSNLFVLLATMALFATASNEEQQNLQKFGLAYADYMQATKRFIPFIF